MTRDWDNPRPSAPEPPPDWAGTKGARKSARATAEEKQRYERAGTIIFRALEGVAIIGIAIIVGRRFGGEIGGGVGLGLIALTGIHNTLIDIKDAMRKRAERDQ